MTMKSVFQLIELRSLMQIMLMYLRLEGAPRRVRVRSVHAAAVASALAPRRCSREGVLARTSSRAHAHRRLAHTPCQEHNRDYLFSELGADDGAADPGGVGAGMAE